MTSHQLAEFGGHGHLGGGDMMILVCHMISHDPVIKDDVTFYKRTDPVLSYHLSKFGSHRQSDSEDTVVLICHVISQGHLLKGSCDFIVRSLSK